MDGVITTKEVGHESFEGQVVASFDENVYSKYTTVYFSEYAGADVFLDGHKYLILDEKDIWATREPTTLTEGEIVHGS